MRFIPVLFSLAGLLSPFCMAKATELVHRFESPSFGGNPLNGTFLLNQAEQQNKFKDPQQDKKNSRSQQSDLERFKDRLQQAILNKISQNSVNGLFDDNGNIVLGSTLNVDLDGDGVSDFMVTVADEPIGDSLSITISDGITETQLTVPYNI